MNDYKLRELRESRGYTQTDIARRLGITQQAYAYYEIGRRLPNIQLLCELADLYGVSLDYLFGRDDKPHPYMPLQPVELPAVPSGALTEKEKDLLDSFRKLNEEGQNAAYSMIRGLVDSGAYIKSAVSGQIQIG